MKTCQCATNSQIQNMAEVMNKGNKNESSDDERDQPVSPEIAIPIAS